MFKIANLKTQVIMVKKAEQVRTQATVDNVRKAK